jgi:Flp pilus assembly protein TadG
MNDPITGYKDLNMTNLSNASATLRRFGKDKRGNVLMIMGFALIPITLAAGMTVDYTRAARLKTKLDAAADAAVLSAVAEASATADDKTVCERAAQLFNSQANGINNSIYSRANLTITVGSSSGVNPVNVSYNGTTNTCSNPATGNPASSAASRVVSLNYAIQSTNFFGGILDRDTLPVSGGSGSKVSAAPDVDFYIALDTSPSMALPVTTTGIDGLVRATAMYADPNNVNAYSSSYTETKKGCAFACHSNKIQNYVGGSLGETPQDTAKYAIVKESTPRTGMFSGNSVTYVDGNNAFVYNSATRKVCYDGGSRYGSTSSSGCTSGKYRVDKNIYYADGSFVDTYWYARNKGITLRIDEMRRATADLVDTALSEAEKNEATYRAAIFGFDSQEHFRRIYPTSSGLVKIAEKPTAATYSATITSGNAFKAKALSDDIDIALIDDKTGNGCPLGYCSGNNYLFTSFKGLFDGMLGTGFLPATSGTGLRKTMADTPQAFLFIITDGMSDEKASWVAGLWSNSSDRTRSEITGPGTDSHLNKCDAIKARGIQIAILYTEYTSESIASDEQSQKDWVNGRIPFVEPALRTCASPNYFLKVSSNGDISAALQALLRKAVSSPRLVK